MNILIVGCGKMGRYLSSLLVNENYNVTLLDKNETILEKLNNTMDISIIEGNALIADTLIKADVKNMDIVICTMKNDEDNLLCSLLSKKLGCTNTICRVTNPDYLKNIDYLKDELGLSMVINPDLLTARDIENSLIYKDNTKISYLSKGKVQLIEYKINNNSILNDISLKDLKKKIKTNIIILGVERDNEYIVPNGDIVLKENDKILLTALKKDIKKFFKEINEELININDLMIIGGSKISYYLAKSLEESNINIKIIENDLDKCKKLADNLDKTLIINGDGSDEHLLIEEGIENTDVFIAATGIDEENVVFSMFANTLNIKKVITKINHLNFVNFLSSVGIKSIITPHIIASNQILRYIKAKDNSRGGNMETLIKLNNMEIIEFRINDKFKKNNKPLRKIKFIDNLIICCINRNGKIIFPTGDDTIEIGDLVVLATTKKGIKGFNDILG